MSDPLTTNHLKLPYLAAAQAQKHVTHNEALTLLDTAVQLAVLDATLTAPPGTPAEGNRHIVAATATGAWAGKEGNVATWVDGAWAFAAPDEGWLAFDIATETILVFLSGAWQAAAGGGMVDKLGVNATADDTNRLAVRSAAVLFSGIAAADGGTGDIRFTIDKETDADTASLLFQSGWSGRAEVGLAGDTDLVFKVSPDGTTWTEAIRIDKTTGLPTIRYDNATSGLAATNVQAAIDEVAAGGGGGGGAVASVFGRTGAVAAALHDYDASQVDNDSGVAGATVKDALDALSSGKQASDADLTAIAGLSPANDDVIQRKAGAWTNRTIAQLKADLAISAPDIVSGVSNTEFGYLDGVTSAIQTQLNAKAPLASPTFSGTPAAPTATSGTNTTQLATTAFVTAAVAALSTIYQAVSSVLGAFAALAPSANDFLQFKSGAWANRTPAQAAADLPAVVGDSGSGGTKGLVPAPGAGDAAAAKFLKANGTWDVPSGSGSGDVVGPASAADGTPMVADGTTGKLIKNITFAAFKTALSLAKGDVGLGSVDNLQQVPLSYLDTDGTLAANSDAKVASQKAAKTYVAAAVAALSSVYQAAAAILGALAALGSNGLIARTGSGTVAARTITGTANHLTVTNGDGASGNPTLDVGTSVALLDAADQMITGGARVTVDDLGTKSSGTVTPDPGDRPHQKYTNNGAHTLAPGTNQGSYWLDITNGASAGAITTSGWTKVGGDSFDTTNAHKFACVAHISDVGSLLIVQAMQ